MANLDGEKLEEVIKDLEKMLSSASDLKDSERENTLAEAVDFLTELGVLGFGRLPEEEPFRGLLTGQYFEHPDGEGLCIVKEDHMQAGGVAFVIVEGDRAGEEGYADKQEQLDRLVKVVDAKIVRR
jgi:hypothetical protein